MKELRGSLLTLPAHSRLALDIYQAIMSDTLYIEIHTPNPHKKSMLSRMLSFYISLPFVETQFSCGLHAEDPRSLWVS